MVLVAPAIALAGCAGVVVHEGGERRGGIPFYVKTPVAVQDTTLATSEVTVRVKVSEVAVREGKVAVMRFSELPAAGPLRVPEEQRGLLRLDDLLKDNDKKPYDETVAKVIMRLDALRSLSARPADKARCGVPAVVANSWALKMEVGPARHYIETRMPLIGSANTKFDFSADGTMTAASADIKNETASTLLALFPITEKLSKQWGLDSAGKDAQAAAAQAIAGMRKADPKPRKDGKPPPTLVKVAIEITVSDVKTAYALRRVHHFDNGNMNDYASLKQKSGPLSLCDAFDGKNETQLISIGPVGPQPPNGKPEDEAPAWQIRGSLTPPKSDGGGSQKTTK
jgi:hypothetical protein